MNACQASLRGFWFFFCRFLQTENDTLLWGELVPWITFPTKMYNILWNIETPAKVINYGFTVHFTNSARPEVSKKLFCFCT